MIESIPMNPIQLPIYMDHHATTPVDPRVAEDMLPALREQFGNPASRNHPFGWAAEKLVEKARIQVAKILHADLQEIVFTAGTTESNNLALKGGVEMYREKGSHLITQPTEHKSVLDTAKFLAKKGVEVTYLRVDPTGLVDLDSLKRAVTGKTVLISIMAANNEVGTIQPLEAIGKIAKEKGVLFHVDAAQAVGKIPIDVEKMGIDLLSFSGHKMYGPKGVGALYIRRKNPRVRLVPLIHGGGQEGGVRSGTLNVAGIVGLGRACEIASQEMAEEGGRLLRLRTKLHQTITNELEEVYLNGHAERRLPGNLNLSFAYVDGESLLMAVSDEIAVSSGSACTTATQEPSYVLKALGTREDLIHASIRFGLGRFNTEAEVDYVSRKVIETVKRLREMSPIYQSVRTPGPKTAKASPETTPRKGDSHLTG